MYVIKHLIFRTNLVQVDMDMNKSKQKHCDEILS